MKNPLAHRLAAAALLGTLLLVSATGAARADDQTCQAADRQLEMATRELTRAADVLSTCQSGEATGFLDLGRLELSAAAEARSLGRCRMAYERAAKAFGLADRAIVLCRPTLDGRPASVEAAVTRELERTDDVIARVASRVRESGNDRARLIFERAVQRQREARRLFTDGVTRVDLNPTLALDSFRRVRDLTRSARDEAVEAGRLAQGDRVLNPDRVSDELRRTEEQIATAEEWSQGQGAGAGESDRLEQLNAAKVLEERARRFFVEGQLEQAMYFTFRAREIVRRVLSPGSGKISATDLDRAFQRAEQAMTQAHSAVLSGEGQHFLSLADSRYARAVQDRQAGRPRLALLGAEASEAFAYRALSAHK